MGLEVCVDLLHRHPDYWTEPDKFYPERFIENPQLAKAEFYLPFGAGPRNCIGMRLALLEIRLGILRIFQKFDVSFPDDFVDDVKLVRNPYTFLSWSKPTDFVFSKRK